MDYDPQAIAITVTLALENQYYGHITEYHDDLIQEAVVKLIEVNHSDARFAFRVAKGAVMDYLKSIWRDRDAIQDYCMLFDYHTEKIYVNIDDLVQYFLSHRVKRGERGENAARNMAKICQLLLDGVTDNKTIASKLELGYENVKKYRKQIKAILRGEGEDVAFENVYDIHPIFYDYDDDDDDDDEVLPGSYLALLRNRAI